MERDFTAKCYEDFCAMIDRINDENWCGITDWFGDCFWGLKHLLADWGLLDYTDKMDVYYKELLDREDTSKEYVIQVFEGISDLDTSFSSSEPNHFGYCRAWLNDFRQCLNSANRLISRRLSGSVSDVFTPTGFDLLKLQIHSLTQPGPQFSASTFDKLSREQKNDYVRQCEELCPNLAKELNLLFTDPDWTTQEKLDIKFLIYSAPEPYRSVFLRHSTSYQVVLFQDGSKDSDFVVDSMCDSENEKIYLEDGDINLRDHPQAPYYAVFHEFGHEADYATHETARCLSHSFEINGNTLMKYIGEDARNYVSNYINSTEPYQNLSDGEKALLLASLNLTEKTNPPYGGSTAGLSAQLADYHEQIADYMAANLQKESDSSASDIYGGVTNNAIVGTRGHKGEDQRYYWYNTKGNSTNRQTSELWAEFFGAQMTHDEESLASIKEHFPTAYPMLEEMARQMAAK